MEAIDQAQFDFSPTIGLADPMCPRHTSLCSHLPTIFAQRRVPMADDKVRDPSVEWAVRIERIRLKSSQAHLVEHVVRAVKGLSPWE